MNRYSILIAWESGSGLVTSGNILIHALINEWYYVVADREYPSLIRWGHACYKIQFSDRPIFAMSQENDIVLCVDRIGLKNYVSELKEWGILIQWDERHHLMQDILSIIEENKIKNVYLPERKTVTDIGGNLLMTNILMLWVLWKVLWFSYDSIKKEVTKKFKSKPALLKLDLRCLEIGYTHEVA